MIQSGVAYTNPFGATYIFGSLCFRCSLIDHATYTYFGAAYIFCSFGGNIQSIKSFDEDLRREYSKWVSEINIYIIAYTNCVSSTSTDVCERGFSKQNWVKSERKTCLNLDTLDALMRVSLNSLGVEFMDWNGIFDSWKTATITNKHRALSLQEVELDG
jgi:hypothetical protein